MDNEKKAVTADQLATAYIKIRDRRTARKREFDEADSIDKDKLNKLETAMLNMCNAIDSNSMNTDHGTIIRSISTRYWTNDWGSFDKLVVEQNIPQLLERRIAQRNMAQFLEENPELMPAGLNVQNEYVVTVRRKA